MAGSLKGGPNNMALLGVLGNADYSNELANCQVLLIMMELTESALGIINPVGGKETTEGRHKDNATVIGDRLSDSVDL